MVATHQPGSDVNDAGAVVPLTKVVNEGGQGSYFELLLGVHAPRQLLGQWTQGQPAPCQEPGLPQP